MSSGGQVYSQEVENLRTHFAYSALPSGLNLSEQFGVLIPVPLDFRHDALKFGISAQTVPFLVALQPGLVVIPYSQCLY
jgi:hypothetical protein